MGISYSHGSDEDRYNPGRAVDHVAIERNRAEWQRSNEAADNVNSAAKHIFAASLAPSTGNNIKESIDNVVQGYVPEPIANSVASVTSTIANTISQPAVRVSGAVLGGMMHIQAGASKFESNEYHKTVEDRLQSGMKEDAAKKDAFDLHLRDWN
jgi:hypothetical protein